MDRRQRKTREAIFGAFTQLLSQKDLGRITVGEIIRQADVGRATFYDHFPTKDDLLKELSRELFCHIFDGTDPEGCSHRHIFVCDAPDAVFLHLLRHLHQNDNQITTLLRSRNGDLFLGYFKAGLTDLVQKQYETLSRGKPEGLPDEFWRSHITATFLETLKWWLTTTPQTPPETVHQYFLKALNL